jgi:hypothetical protein
VEPLLHRRPLPTLSLQSIRRRFIPYPAVFSRCACSLLPGRRWPHVRFELQIFAYVQAPTLARLQIAPAGADLCLRGSRAVSTTQPLGWLPAQAVVSLRAQDEQLLGVCAYGESSFFDRASTVRNRRTAFPAGLGSSLFHEHTPENDVRGFGKPTRNTCEPPCSPTPWWLAD